jgi:hypothetical protein
MVAAYLLSGLVALWLLYWLWASAREIEPTLAEQFRAVWKAPVIRVKVTK